VPKRSTTKSNTRKNSAVNSNAEPGLKEFVHWLTELHLEIIKFADTFTEPMRSLIINAADSTLFAIFISFLLFMLMIFGSVFSLQPITIFTHNIDPIITFVILWAASFLYHIVRKYQKTSKTK
jgi:hypothetical protein